MDLPNPISGATIGAPSRRQVAKRARGNAGKLPDKGLSREALALLVLLATCMTAFVPGLRLDVMSAADQVAVETASTLIATLAAVLFLDRFARHLRLRDLLLAAALALIAVSRVSGGVLLANHTEVAGHSAAWLVLGGRISCWVLILGAALAGDRRLRHIASGPIRLGLTRIAWAAGGATLAVAIAANLVSSESVPAEPLGSPTATLIAQILILALAAAAAFVFRREAARTKDVATRAMALAAALGAGAALSYCATPALYTSHVALGDILRVAYLAVLLLAVCVEWSLDERRMRSSALERERRRMAADVHDLIMQDLAYALANARTLAENPAAAEDPASIAQASTVVMAGERALAGAREVVLGLTDAGSGPITETIASVTKAAARHTPFSFDGARIPDSAQLPDQPTRDALVHIAREAVTNSVKHARADSVEVQLEHSGEWRLTVRDDGRGFDPAGGGEGFGLTSMRQHARALGGVLRISGADGQGTTVEVVLP